MIHRQSARNSETFETKDESTSSAQFTWKPRSSHGARRPDGLSVIPDRLTQTDVRTADKKISGTQIQPRLTSRATLRETPVKTLNKEIKEIKRDLQIKGLNLIFKVEIL